MSSTSPLTGKLSQLFSPRICMFTSTIIMAIGVLVTASAGDFTAFIAGRIVTGIGAAGIFTVSIIIVLELSSPKRRGIMIGLLNSGYTVGVALGATFAGALLSKTGWRALFWMQAPIAIFGGTILLVCIPRDFTAGKQDTSGDSIFVRLGRLDYFGAASLTSGIVFLLFALSSPKNIPILPILLSFIILVTFVLNEAYVAREPIVPVTLLKSRGLLFTCLGTVGYMMARWSVLFYAPTYAIAIRDWPPGVAGSILIATNGGFGLGGILVGWIHIRRHGSFYIPSLVVYAIFPFTLAALALLSTSTSSSALYITVLFLNGFCTGAALNYTLAHLLHLTPSSTHYIATSLVATFRGFAGSFGSAIGGGFFVRVLNESLQQGFRKAGLKDTEGLRRRLLGSPALVGGLNGAERDVAVRGYEDATRALFLAAAGLAALMVLVQAATGWRGAAKENDADQEEGVGVEEEESVRD
ncbi:hypothetical protein MBLNU459_g6790t1 [Dothideomycetes sp. NU459]